MEAAVNPDSKNSWLHKPVTPLFPGVTVEHLLVTLIIIAAVISRFYAVGLRVMSHDEVNHVVPSYELYQGRGYAHDPVTHGPLQFHLLAASYFLMGDSDFASRVPAALFSIGLFGVLARKNAIAILLGVILTTAGVVRFPELFTPL